VKRFALLDAVAETIMPRTDTPGARDAGVPKRINVLMNTMGLGANPDRLYPGVG
jgi:hypothetical protein